MAPPVKTRSTATATSDGDGSDDDDDANENTWQPRKEQVTHPRPALEHTDGQRDQVQWVGQLV